MEHDSSSNTDLIYNSKVFLKRATTIMSNRVLIFYLIHCNEMQHMDKKRSNDKQQKYGIRKNYIRRHIRPFQLE